MCGGCVFQRIILVTGTPCVGKTSVSRGLAARLKALHVDLGEVVAKEKLSSGEDKERGSLIADRAKLSRRVREIIKSQAGRRDVVVDGHYATDVVRARDVARVFVLRRHPRELKRLMLKRGFKGSKLWENLAAEILDTCLIDAISAVGLERVCELDVTGMKTEDIVNDIVLFLSGEKLCVRGGVDWLGRLEREGLLDEFLREF